MTADVLPFPTGGRGLQKNVIPGRNTNVRINNIISIDNNIFSGCHPSFTRANIIGVLIDNANISESKSNVEELLGQMSDRELLEKIKFNIQQSFNEKSLATGLTFKWNYDASAIIMSDYLSGHAEGELIVTLEVIEGNDAQVVLFLFNKEIAWIRGGKLIDNDES